MIDWEGVKAVALGLGLPGVAESAHWGQPGLKAHGKLWTWWSPHAEAPVFKVAFEEREMLVEMAPERFFFTPHYRNYPLVLMWPAAFDAAWARGNLLLVWRAMAPKRVLRAYDAGQGGG